MATIETQQIDEIISSRRAMLTMGGAALAGLVFAGSARAQSTSGPTDADILNFALNLEYLEANFYYLAAFGTTIDVQNAASKAAGAPVCPITGTGTQGTVTVRPGSMVPFATIQVGSYATETAVEEGKHVALLQSALGTGTAVAQPAIDLLNSFNTLAMAAGIGPAFDPFASDANFLIGAYIFEDVGVTAYSGAASLLNGGVMNGANKYLGTAAGILAVEAYHAGMIRTRINTLDPDGVLGYQGLTQKISKVRTALAQAVLPPPATGQPALPPDDYGLGMQTVTLAGTAGVDATTIVDANPADAITFARTPTQILNIVTGGGAWNGTKTVSPAKGVFFPAGLNGNVK